MQTWQPQCVNNAQYNAQRTQQSINVYRSMCTVATIRQVSQSRWRTTDGWTFFHPEFLNSIIGEGLEDLRSASREVVATQWVFSTPESLKGIITRGSSSSGDIRHQSQGKSSIFLCMRNTCGRVVVLCVMWGWWNYNDARSHNHADAQLMDELFSSGIC